MNISIISTYYGEEIGGAEISTKLLVEGLQKTANQVEIITLNNFFNKIPLSLRAFLLNTNLLDSYIEKYIYNKLKSSKPDIVHIQDLMISPAAIKAAKKLNLKTIITIRDLRFACNLPVCQNYGKLYPNCNDERYLKCLKIQAKQEFNLPILAHLLFPLIHNRSKYLRESLFKVDKIIALTKFVKSEIIKFGFDDDNIEVVYNPMPDWKSRKANPHTEFILFAPGRLEKYKGFQLVIEAMPKILKQKPNTVLWIAGVGGYELELKSLVKKLKLEQYVKFLGKLSQEEIKERYFDCDLVIFPSIWLESQGRIPLEAMAAKKPLIANNVGGIIETAGSENVCNMFNQDELVREILKKRMPMKSRKDLTINNFTKQIIQIYNETKT